jgi:hypothetical protein
VTTLMRCPGGSTQASICRDSLVSEKGRGRKGNEKRNVI